MRFERKEKLFVIFCSDAMRFISASLHFKSMNNALNINMNSNNHAHKQDPMFFKLISYCLIVVNSVNKVGIPY